VAVVPGVERGVERAVAGRQTGVQGCKMGWGEVGGLFERTSS
jgi:hypothetical protein